MTKFLALVTIVVILIWSNVSTFMFATTNYRSQQMSDYVNKMHEENEAVSSSTSTLTTTSISTTSTVIPTSTERILVQVYESLNNKTRFQEALNSSLPPTIYSCNVQGNGEFQNVIHSILPEYKLDDQKLKTGPRGYEWHSNLMLLESTQYDIFLNTYEMSCSHAAMTWLMRKFKGQYIFVTGESFHNAMYEKENDFIDPRKHTFAHVPETPRDQTLTYLQVSWMFFFRDALPLPAMLDGTGSIKPKGNRTHFLVYGQSNCVGFRNEAFGKLSTIAPVHQSGKCGANGIQDHSNVTKVESGINIHNWRNNINHYAEYRFCLVMEHEDPVEHPDYVTEKIMMAFVAGCIPIYYGPDMIFDIFNDKAFVFYNISDPQPALDQVRKMEFDRDAYEEMALQPILKNGNETVEKYFSFSDDIENGALKRRFREKLHLP